MKLSSILNGYSYELVMGSLDVEVESVENDSRKVRKGSLFIAEKGYTVDGHDYIDMAIQSGAVAILIDRDIDIKNENVTVIKVENTLDAMAKIASNFYLEPYNKLNMIGITGTNGKTSTTYFLRSILKRKQKVGLIGTMGAIIDEKELALNNTTPNSLKVQKLLSEMFISGVDSCMMEVSSHALDLKRVEYMDFDIGVFTNLSKDHLDHHLTMENYFNSKKKLFDKVKSCNIINIDDSYGKRLLETVNKDIKTVGFSVKSKADVFATDIVFSLSKVAFKLNILNDSIDVKLNVPGEFSIYNALAAAAVAYQLNMSLEDIKLGLESVEGVKGRFEVIPTDTDYTVIIDFAHTADGLDKVLSVIDQFAEARKIVVFGAGGNRDKTKRPEMGEVVGQHADLSIVTSDNPRYENPQDIIDDIIVGTKRSGGDYVTIVDRVEAIKYALDMARPKDIILLAGKGHETYTLIGNQVIPCDEREIVLRYLNEN